MTEQANRREEKVVGLKDIFTPETKIVLEGFAGVDLVVNGGAAMVANIPGGGVLLGIGFGLIYDATRRVIKGTSE